MLAVEIFTAQEGVAVGRLHFEHAVADFEHGNVEGAATKVIDRDQSCFRSCRGRRRAQRRSAR
jgi:hypothetical protein